MKRIIILLIFLVLQTSFCNSQSKKCDTISFYDLKFNGNNFYVKFEKIKKYINDTKTKATVSPSRYVKIPFKNFKDKDNVYMIYSDFFDFSYTNDSKNIFIQRIKIIDKIDLRINKIKITDNLKIQDIKKFFPNIYENNDKEYQLKLLIKKDKKTAYLFFNFKNNKLSDVMLDN
ncbi:hypothetical protein ASF10_20430 [Flavobacterium sp. Leaf82]|uniref:hypothetical protein n=1 Tax=Flavobacterium sp. Leaf82 TaxID=1736238 RepID=UPI0006FDFCAC|nr:hypothetical protein [Flavobacterium sp. Leaf82]KQO32822.1 hypothetical protein ASF10_20430 [Flavobacterium sp. Leaf82]